jgi:hypothetical protein
MQAVFFSLLGVFRSTFPSAAQEETAMTSEFKADIGVGSEFALVFTFDQ